MPEDKQSWWSTLPGVITAVATLITAIGGLIIIMRSADHSSQQQMRQPTSDDPIQQPISQPGNDRPVQQQTTQPMSRRTTTTARFATVIAGDFLALKVAPDITSKRILKIDPNEVVQILFKTSTCETIGGIYDCWYKIIYKGAEGYAFGGYLHLQN